ncbi:hypothetical protein QBC39DRAFT_253756 [Podospora conica]|nr:hypothetical protein QBC39DRAFT_253756 [Schizothecium conicum]
MHFLSLVSVLGAATLATCQTDAALGPVTGKLGDAPAVTNTAVGDTWVATFDGTQNGIKGTVTAVGAKSGVDYTLDFAALPTEQGPFGFHVHAKALPVGGTCADTGAHLDSYQRGQEPVCDAANPQRCEVGDLSGKFGKVAGPAAKKSFNDPYSGVDAATPAFIGELAIVFHNSTAARVACANLVKV